MPDDVAEAFARFSPTVRTHLLDIRRLILATAASLPDVGALTETLKWGEPAYLTAGSGSTIRLGVPKSAGAEECAVLFNCRTTLVAEFRDRFPDTFTFQGNRAVMVRTDAPLPEDALATCIAEALTYKRRPAKLLPNKPRSAKTRPAITRSGRKAAHP